MQASHSIRTSCQGSCSSEGPRNFAEMDNAIVKVNPGKNYPGRNALMNFLASSPKGQFMSRNVLGIDDVEPSKLRLKICFTTHATPTSTQSERP